MKLNINSFSQKFRKLDLSLQKKRGIIDKIKIKAITKPPLGNNKKVEKEKISKKLNTLSKKTSMTNFFQKNLFYHPLFLLFIYLLLHATIRILLSSTLQVDDREQIFFASELQMGYPMPQPPLYSWLSFYSFKALGVNLFALTLLKYSLIFATFTYIYLSAKKIFCRKLLQNLTVFSYLLMPSFAWHLHQGFTHTVILGLSIAMTFFYILKIRNNQNVKNYIYLGIAIGIGMLSKYSFFIFLTLIFFAGFFTSTLRDKFLNKKIFLTIVISIALATPHFIWIANNFELISSQALERLVSEKNLSFTQIYFEFFKSSFGFIFPLILVLLINIRVFFIHDLTKDKQWVEIFLDNFFIVLLFLSFIVFIFFDFKEVKVRWLHPILMLFPFWAFLKFSKNYDLISPIFKKTFLYIVIAFSLLIFTIRLVQLTIAPKYGYYSRVNIPIISALKETPREFIDNSSVVRSEDYFLGPHLISFFKDKKILVTGKSFNSKVKSNGKCLIFWDNDGHDDSTEYLNKKYDGKITKYIYDYEYSLFYKLVNIEDCE